MEKFRRLEEEDGGSAGAAPQEFVQPPAIAQPPAEIQPLLAELGAGVTAEAEPMAVEGNLTSMQDLADLFGS